MAFEAKPLKFNFTALIKAFEGSKSSFRGELNDLLIGFCRLYCKTHCKIKSADSKTWAKHYACDSHHSHFFPEYMRDETGIVADAIKDHYRQQGRHYSSLFPPVPPSSKTLTSPSTSSSPSSMPPSLPPPSAPPSPSSSSAPPSPSPTFAPASPSPSSVPTSSPSSTSSMSSSTSSSSPSSSTSILSTLHNASPPTSSSLRSGAISTSSLALTGPLLSTTPLSSTPPAVTTTAPTPGQASALPRLAYPPMGSSFERPPDYDPPFASRTRPDPRSSPSPSLMELDQDGDVDMLNSQFLQDEDWPGEDWLGDQPLPQPEEPDPEPLLLSPSVAKYFVRKEGTGIPIAPSEFYPFENYTEMALTTWKNESALSDRLFGALLKLLRDRRFRAEDVPSKNNYFCKLFDRPTIPYFPPVQRNGVWLVPPEAYVCSALATPSSSKDILSALPSSDQGVTQSFLDGDKVRNGHFFQPKWRKSCLKLFMLGSFAQLHHGELLKIKFFCRREDGSEEAMGQILRYQGDKWLVTHKTRNVELSFLTPVRLLPNDLHELDEDGNRVNTEEFTKSVVDRGLPLVSLALTFYTDGWSKGSGSTLESFQMALLQQPRSARPISCLCTARSEDWLKAYTLLMTHLHKLSSGFSAHCSFLRETVWVEAAVYAIVADNPRAASLTQTNLSCIHYCRFGHCSRRTSLEKGLPRTWENTMANVQRIKNAPNQSQKALIVRDTGTCPSGVGSPTQPELDVHQDIPNDLLHNFRLGLIKTLMEHVWKTLGSEGQGRLKVFVKDHMGFREPLEHFRNFVGRDFGALMLALPIALRNIGAPADLTLASLLLCEVYLFFFLTSHKRDQLQYQQERIITMFKRLYVISPTFDLPKAHLVAVHGIEDIRRHGAVVDFNTERYEATIQRGKKGFKASNKKSVSRDIALDEARSAALAHIIQGGEWYPEDSQMLVCAGKGVRDFVGSLVPARKTHPHLQLSRGISAKVTVSGRDRLGHLVLQGRKARWICYRQGSADEYGRVAHGLLRDGGAQRVVVYPLARVEVESILMLEQFKLDLSPKEIPLACVKAPASFIHDCRFHGCSKEKCRGTRYLLNRFHIGADSLLLSPSTTPAMLQQVLGGSLMHVASDDEGSGSTEDDADLPFSTDSGSELDDDDLDD